MKDAGVSRFVGISVSGLDVPGDAKGVRDRIIGSIARTLAGSASADRAQEYEAWAASGLAWTLLRVPRLIDKEISATTAPIVDPHRPPRGITLHRAALAALLIDCAVSGQFLCAAPFAADR